jgi:hypothetical protein
VLNVGEAAEAPKNKGTRLFKVRNFDCCVRRHEGNCGDVQQQNLAGIGGEFGFSQVNDMEWADSRRHPYVKSIIKSRFFILKFNIRRAMNSHLHLYRIALVLRNLPVKFV